MKKRWAKVGIYFLVVSCFFTCKRVTKPTTNTVSIRLAANPDKINPILSRSTYARQVAQHIFPTLLDIDPQSLSLRPKLAKQVPIISTKKIDGKIYTAYNFELEEAAVWDNGLPVTAQDYLFTLKIIFNPKVNAHGLRSYLSFIHSIELDTLNAKSFSVITQNKNILNLNKIGLFEIYPAYHYDKDHLLQDISFEDLKNEKNLDDQQKKKLQRFADLFQSTELSRAPEQVIGCGPYQLKEWVTDQYIILQKKENWWGNRLAKKKPALLAYPNQFHYQIIPDQTAAISLLKSGKLDALSGIPSNDFLALQNNPSVSNDFNFYSPDLMQYSFIPFNNDHPILSDIHVRKALAHLIDVEELIKLYTNGLAQRINTPFHPQKSYYHTQLKPIEFNTQLALKHLKDAGWTDTNNNGILDKTINGVQQELKLELFIPPASQLGEGLGLLFQQAAKKVGISVQPIVKEFNLLLQDYKRGTYDMVLLSLRQSTTIDDPYRLWHSNSIPPNGGNLIRFQNVAIDRLIEEIRILEQPEQRDDLYKKFQEIIYENQPCVFLYSKKEPVLIHKKFKCEPSSIRPGYFENTFQLN